MQKYGFDIFWSEEDQGYIATCPDFQGLSAFGDTEEEALQEAKTALKLFVEAINDQGNPVPVATTASKTIRKRQQRRPVVPTVTLSASRNPG